MSTVRNQLLRWAFSHSDLDPWIIHCSWLQSLNAHVAKCRLHDPDPGDLDLVVQYRFKSSMFNAHPAPGLSSYTDGLQPWLTHGGWLVVESVGECKWIDVGWQPGKRIPCSFHLVMQVLSLKRQLKASEMLPLTWAITSLSQFVSLETAKVLQSVI